MIELQSFVNNPYQENTYILFDDSKDCVIIDPGMYTASEQNAVVRFISSEKLNPVLLLNTHCHIDHVLGNKFVFDNYGLKPQFHEGELPLLTAVPSYAPAQGFNYEVSPLPEKFLPESGSISFGNSELELIFAPGHSPAHLCYGSIGRTDLPGVNHSQLLKNIREKLFTLPDDCVVYPGHGGETSIGFEKKHNPFF